MAELVFLSTIITAITTFGKMIYDEIKKAHEEARTKIAETSETILLVVSGDGCMPDARRQKRILKVIEP
jgi:hypothetical protein